MKIKQNPESIFHNLLDKLWLWRIGLFHTNKKCTHCEKKPSPLVHKKRKMNGTDWRRAPWLLVFGGGLFLVLKESGQVRRALCGIQSGCDECRRPFSLNSSLFRAGSPLLSWSQSLFLCSINHIPERRSASGLHPRIPFTQTSPLSKSLFYGGFRPLPDPGRGHRVYLRAACLNSQFWFATNWTRAKLREKPTRGNSSAQRAIDCKDLST